MKKTLTFDEIMQRSRSLKKLVAHELGTAHVTASANPDFATAILRVRTKLADLQKEHDRPVAPSVGARSLEDLLSEVNAISDPCDQTEWWRANYGAIKAAQRRAKYATANKPRNKFLNMILPE